MYIAKMYFGDSVPMCINKDTQLNVRIIETAISISLKAYQC